MSDAAEVAQASIDAFVNEAVIANQAAPPVAPTIVPVAPVFVIAPALVDQTKFINYATRDGSKLFDQAVAKLSTTFDFEDSSELQALLDQIAAHSITCGWSHIFEIDCQLDPVVTGAEVMRNLLTAYGSMCSYICTCILLVYLTHYCSQC